jgi:outer membrane immunogenic protein
MKRFSRVIALLLLLGSASAAEADPPLKRIRPLVPPLRPMWSGFYAGASAGYSFGANNEAVTTAVPVRDDYVDAIRDYWAIQGPFKTYSIVPWGFASLANTGTANIKQNGLIVGGQIGYNYHLVPKFVFGVEADIQNTSISGNTSYASSFHGSSFLHLPPAPAFNPIDITRTLLHDAVGSGSVKAGVDWLATVRGRFGWLAAPTLLLFGTGGVALGGVHASAVHSMGMQETYLYTYDNVAYSGGSSNWIASGGNGNYYENRIGWTAGGGGEWMFMPNLSLKAEALYYDLGGTIFASSPVVIDIPPGGVYAGFGRQVISNIPFTRVKFDGIIVRGGISYHFN